MKELKNISKTVVLLLPFYIFLFIAGCSFPIYQNQNTTDAGDTTQQAYNIDDLNNYGEWVNISKFGSVWRPYVVEGWMPYDNGHWTYADGNWEWVSYEPFGWIVYHYGNWYDDVLYGWVWVPSNDPWSPARVIWTDYDDYVGWAPLPPAGVTYTNPWEMNGNHYWHVVKHEDFTEDNIRNYRVSNPGRSQTETRGVMNRAPNKSEIETRVKKTITEYKFQPQTVKLPKRDIKRMTLPQQENNKVQQNLPRVKKEVLVPRDQFQKQQNERTQQQPQKDKKQEQKKEDPKK